MKKQKSVTKLEITVTTRVCHFVSGKRSPKCPVSRINSRFSAQIQGLSVLIKYTYCETLHEYLRVGLDGFQFGSTVELWRNLYIKGPQNQREVRIVNVCKTIVIVGKRIHLLFIKRLLNPFRAHADIPKGILPV